MSSTPLADDSRVSRFLEGPEGRKQFEKWLKDQPQEFQDSWAEENEKHRDKFKQAGGSIGLEVLRNRVAFAVQELDSLEEELLSEEAMFAKGEKVPLSDLPVELQKNVENPPPAVQKLKDEMEEEGMHHKESPAIPAEITRLAAFDHGELENIITRFLGRNLEYAELDDVHMPMMQFLDAVAEAEDRERERQERMGRRARLTEKKAGKDWGPVTLEVRGEPGKLIVSFEGYADGGGSIEMKGEAEFSDNASLVRALTEIELEAAHQKRFISRQASAKQAKKKLTPDALKKHLEDLEDLVDRMQAYEPYPSAPLQASIDDLFKQIKEVKQDLKDAEKGQGKEASQGKKAWTDAIREIKDHPAFEDIISRTQEEGVMAVLVKYREDNPNFEGGYRVEVYDPNGELLLDEDARRGRRTDLRPFLRRGLEEWDEMEGRTASTLDGHLVWEDGTKVAVYRPKTGARDKSMLVKITYRDNGQPCVELPGDTPYCRIRPGKWVNPTGISLIKPIADFAEWLEKNG